MRVSDISNIRLNNQQISATKFKSPNEIIGWMGAMQAQEFLMAKWAIGVRLPDSTEKIIENAFDKGEILRTHLLRPTWHIVSPDDIYWLIELTAPPIRSSLKTRHKELGLTEGILRKSNQLQGQKLIHIFSKS